MANTRSAEKQQRQAEKANARNRAGKSRLRSALKKTRAAVDSGNADASVALHRLLRDRQSRQDAA